MDSEPVGTETKTSREDVLSLFTLVGLKNAKIAVFLFMLYLLISSDVFIDRVLGDKYSFARMPTTTGTCIQASILAMVYVLIHVLVSNDLI